MSKAGSFRVASLSQGQPTAFSLRPDAAELAALARDLDLSGLRKLSFEGEIRPENARDWRLDATLGATVVQPCIVTLDPVTTRIDVPVERVFVAGMAEPEGEEVEMDPDDTREPLGDTIDVERVMAEALALALPLYPRKADAELGEAVYAAPGVAAMRDEDAKPFAGLAGLRSRLSGEDEE